MDFLAGYKTHILVAGAIAQVIFNFLGGEIDLNTMSAQVMQLLMVSTFKVGVDRGLK